MSSVSTLEEIKNKFTSQCGLVPRDDWLNSLFSRNISNFQKIWEDFLTTNICRTTLPFRELRQVTEPCLKLSKSVVVQINEVVDISLPNSDRIAFKQSPKGTLKFLMSHGDQIFIGIEKEKLDSSIFNTTLVPGCKVRISKGTEFRYGVLFIRKNNIELLKSSFAPDLIEKREQIYQSAGTQRTSKLQRNAAPVVQAQPLQPVQHVQQAPPQVPVQQPVQQSVEPMNQNTSHGSNPNKQSFFDQSSSSDGEFDEAMIYKLAANNSQTNALNQPETHEPTKEPEPQKMPEHPKETYTGKIWKLSEILTQTPSSGKVYYVDTNVLSLEDIHLNGDKLEVTARIGDQELSVVVFVEEKYAHQVLEISSVDQWRMLEEDDEFTRKSQFGEELTNLEPPIKIVDKGEIINGIQFELHND